MCLVMLPRVSLLPHDMGSSDTRGTGEGLTVRTPVGEHTRMLSGHALPSGQSIHRYHTERATTTMDLGVSHMVDTLGHRGRAHSVW